MKLTEETKIFDGVDAHEFEMEYLIKHIDEPVSRQILTDHKKAIEFDFMNDERQIKLVQNEVLSFKNHDLNEIVERLKTRIKELKEIRERGWGLTISGKDQLEEFQKILGEKNAKERKTKEPEPRNDPEKD